MVYHIDIVGFIDPEWSILSILFFLLRCEDCLLRSKEINILEVSLASLLVEMDNSCSSTSS